MEDIVWDDEETVEEIAMGNKVLLRETVRAREEIINIIDNNSAKTYSLLTVIILVSGIFALPLFDATLEISLPIVYSFSLLMVALFGALWVVSPKYRNAMVPSGMNKLVNDGEYVVQRKFIVAYLIQQNSLYDVSIKVPYIISIIIWAIGLAIIEYIFAWASFISLHSFESVNNVSICIWIPFVFVIIRKYLKYRKNYATFKKEE